MIVGTYKVEKDFKAMTIKVYRFNETAYRVYNVTKRGMVNWPDTVGRNFPSVEAAIQFLKDKEYVVTELKENV